jgi:hypothetical protein
MGTLRVWEDNSTSEEGLMTEELRGEICSIRCQIRRGSFKTPLIKILALTLTITNIEVLPVLSMTWLQNTRT